MSFMDYDRGSPEVRTVYILPFLYPFWWDSTGYIVVIFINYDSVGHHWVVVIVVDIH